MARVRVRQHVNPFSYKYSYPVIIPNWDQVYADPARPLHLDIGCARGKFLLNMAQIYPDINFLGTEIRQPLVIEANEHRDRLCLTNLHFLFCNVNISLSVILESLPAGVLQMVTIQFPDPWFKRHHNKRRVVQPELVDTLAQHQTEGGSVFLQSDVELVAQEMGDRFAKNPLFKKQHQQQWLENNPFGVATEREIATLNKNEPIYRMLFKKIR